jgi:hypothetical protein
MNKNLQLQLTHLYPKEMNIYGDRGNIITLQRRCEWRGIELKVVEATLGQKLIKSDMYFMGGGQDNDMYAVFADLIKTKKLDITKEVAQGKIFLLICGAFQLFGKYFLDASARKISGLGILPVETKAPGDQLKDRCLGNLVTEIDPDLLNEMGGAYEDIKSATLVGFENHSGQTYSLIKETETLGRVRYGKGNNAEEKLEGFRFKNVFGSYSHGSLLPKNPHLADLLIYLALQNKYGDHFEWKQLDDDIEWQAHLVMKDRLLH